ncbi:MAG: DedA family protein, partial [Bacteroidota bacterium]|nr:DedA family protein [Bacteroidota bacterium]
RTFVTILAGMAKIDFPKFLIFNFLGATIWIITMVLAGHFLGRIFPNITSYLELIVIGMILVSAIPVVITWFKNRNLLAKD